MYMVGYNKSARTNLLISTLKWATLVLIFITMVCVKTTAFAAYDDININSKDDLINLLTNNAKLISTKTNGLVKRGPRYDEGDTWTQIVENKTIYLNTDITISSDEINASIPQNLGNPICDNSLSILKSSFIGNGHTITINQGTRPIYPLFGEINNPRVTNESWREEHIKDLNIVYNGDVVGSAFARNISGGSRTNKQVDIKINNVNVTVNGNILPQPFLFFMYNPNMRTDDIAKSQPSSQYLIDSKNHATGLSCRFTGAEINGFNLNVTGNIGSEDIIKHEYAKSDVVFSRASALFLERHDLTTNDYYYNIKNININIGGSVLAHSHSHYAHALGLGYNIGHVKVSNYNLKVGKDIKAYADGESVVTIASYLHDGNTASGIAKDLVHVKNTTIDIGGSILALSDSTYGMHNLAFGIGQYCYQTAFSSSQAPEEDPLTIDNVTINVAKDVRAETNKKARETRSGVRFYVAAIGGFANNMQGGLDNNEHFTGNTIAIKGDIVAKGKQDAGFGYCDSFLWGYFEGSNNNFSAKNIIAEEPNNIAFAAPLKHFFRGEGNSVSVDNISINSAIDVAAGFANKVTVYDGSKNKINVKSLRSENPYKVGGFAGEIGTHHNHDEANNTKKPYEYLAPDVKNVNLQLEKFELGTAKNDQIYVGGFVGVNEGPISNSSVCLPNISIKVSDNNESSCIAGFAGYDKGSKIENSSAFINDGINVSGGKAFVGGFVGFGGNINHYNNSAQIGENISVQNIAGASLAGGYGGSTKGGNIQKSTALTFGNISVEHNPSSQSPSINAGFLAKSNGTNIKESSSFVGGKIAAGANEDDSISARLSSPSVGIMQNNAFEHFTVLSHDKDIWKNYFAFSNNTTINNLYYVYVSLINRTAYNVSVNGAGNGTLDSKIGQVQIALRDFQNKYWEESASKDKVNLPYTNFDYLKNPEGINFEHISKDANVLSADASKATLEKYCARHAALLADNNKVTYDILGIKGNIIKVTFDLNYVKENGDPAGIYTTVDIDNGNTVTKQKFPENPVREGFTFIGWKTDDGNTFNADTIVNNDITVYAQWEPSKSNASNKQQLNVPQTDDNSSPIIYISIMLLSLCVLLVIIKKGSVKTK